MGSRKEDERNEKIIRGLMKLPPNRRCINCNSLGPQYVCTTFWTFVCMTCSGIHREFTHRVKSVSMSKFTSQEVEAIQNGGNQRARDIYLKDWDFQMQRLPNNSNADKIREFIKNVYVDRRYIGGKTSEKPPRDKQSLKIQEDETRRASSYHSYSQSPPYDHQYEDRRYGKPVAALSRKPGSDRARYEGNISSFVYSPGRLSDQMYEDRFANEGSVSRMSDYSVSSGGDPFRSEALSPNSHDTGFGSPPFISTRDVINTTIEVNAKRDTDKVPRPKRTVSSGSVGSADSNSGSFNSTDLSGPTNIVLEPEKAARNDLDKTFAFQHLSVPGSLGSVDLFQGQFVEKTVPFSASNVDLFQSAALSAQSLDLFQSAALSGPSLDLFQSAALSAPSLDLFQPSLQTPTPYVPVEQPLQTSLYPSFFPEISLPLSSATSEEAPQSVGESKKEGWATFDSPQKTSVLPGIENNIPAKVNVDNSLGEYGSFSSINRGIQWLPFQKFCVQEPPLTMSNQWHGHLPSVQAPVVNDSQPWNAFKDSTGHLPLERHGQGSKLQESDVGVGVGHNGPTMTTDFDMAYKILYPPMDEAQPVVTNRKSTNPFDLAYDYGLEQSDMMFDMNSLQTALPNPQSTATLLGGSQPWFPQNSGSSYIPAAGQGGLTFMPGEAVASQIPTVTAAEPVASVGGNPFA